MASMWLVSSFSFSFPFLHFLFFLCSCFWTLYLICLLFFLVVHFSSFLSFLIFSPFFFLFLFHPAFYLSVIHSIHLPLPFIFLLSAFHLSLFLPSFPLIVTTWQKLRPQKSLVPSFSPLNTHYTLSPYTTHIPFRVLSTSREQQNTKHLFPSQSWSLKGFSNESQYLKKKQEEKFYPGNPVEIKGIIQGGEKSESNQKKPE